MQIGTPNNATSTSANRLSDSTFAVRIPVITTVTLFVLAAVIGGDVLDPDILLLVRFIGLLMLALGIYTAVVTGQRCAYSRNRWFAGQIAAGSIGLGAGFVWSASAFGAGFVFFMIGVLLCALLIFKEMERRTNRRLARQNIARENAKW